MPEILLFPRLPMRAAMTRLAEVSGKTASELTPMAVGTYPEAIYPATGGARVAEPRLLQIRGGLLESGRSLGFPNATRQDALGAFDMAAANVLLSSMPITPGEASRGEVWSFFSLVLAPDLATWRFPDQNERRLLGGDRNVFQRLWWRAYLLHDAREQDPWRLLRLPEDALVGLMERPGISSNPAVTRAIARGIADIASRLPGDLREDGWRDAYKRIRQRFPLVNLDALSEYEVTAQIGSICGQTIAQALANQRNQSRK